MQETDIKDVISLGKFIKSLRIKKKWKLETLSYRVGVSPSTIQRIETEKSEPKYTTIKNIAAAFEMPISKFFEEFENYNNI